ncbi:hypothetical protein LINPERHAP2_LOCUS27555 [Linum perenne]
MLDHEGRVESHCGGYISLENWYQKAESSVEF